MKGLKTTHHGTATRNATESGRHSRWLIPVVSCFAVAILSTSAYATPVTLESRNSEAVFDPEGSGSALGLTSWIVDRNGAGAVDHLAGGGQQWFWYRVGSQGQEYPIDGANELELVGVPTAVDFDSEAGDDLLLVTYRDSETAISPEMFTIQFRYILTGSADGSGRSDIVEIINVENDGSAPMDFNLFQYVNFNLHETADNDSVRITGVPANTARQTDPASELSETVVVPAPSRWQVGTAAAIGGSLTDGGITNLDNTTGPLIGLDAAWSFQWTRTLNPGGDSLLISKDKNIRPGDHLVPEPSGLLLAAIGLVGLLFNRGRRRTH